MKPSLLRKALAAVKSFSLISLAAFGLSGCGSGGGDSDEFVVAPESLDTVKIRFFDAFDLEFFRTTGTRGNETGGVDYDAIQKVFRVAVVDGNSSVGRDVTIPSVLTDVKYTYVRTGADTGRITVTWNNNEVYPHPEATAGNTPILLGDMFWGGPTDLATELVLDILFATNGTTITSSTTRVRSAYRYNSSFTAPGPAVTTAIPFEFDSTSAQFALGAGGLPVGYDPYDAITDETPSSAVWTSIQGRTVDFVGTDLSRKIAYQSASGLGPDLGVPTEESGSILIDSPLELIFGGSGTYSYARTGGTKAKFGVRYAGGTEVIFELDFEGLEGGNYTDSNAAIGTFIQDLFTDT